MPLPTSPHSSTRPTGGASTTVGTPSGQGSEEAPYQAQECPQSRVEALPDGFHADATFIHSLTDAERGDLGARVFAGDITADEEAMAFYRQTALAESVFGADDDDAFEDQKAAVAREARDEQQRVEASENAERQAKRDVLLSKSTVALWVFAAAVLLVTGGGIYTLHANGVIGSDDAVNRILEPPAVEVSEEPPTHVSDVRVRVRPSDVATADDEPADSQEDSG